MPRSINTFGSRAEPRPVTGETYPVERPPGMEDAPQPLIDSHPLVSGKAMPLFMPQRVDRPEKTEGGIPLKIEADFEPKGDQPEAIAELVAAARENERDQVLLGVTGSGKTFTMAHGHRARCSARP